MTTVPAKICPEPGPRWRCWNCWYCAWHRPLCTSSQRRKRFQNALLFISFRMASIGTPNSEIIMSHHAMYSIITYYLDHRLRSPPDSPFEKEHTFQYISVTSMHLFKSPCSGLQSTDAANGDKVNSFWTVSSKLSDLSHTSPPDPSALGKHFSWELAGICCLALLRGRMVLAEHRRSQLFDWKRTSENQLRINAANT